MVVTFGGHSTVVVYLHYINPWMALPSYWMVSQLTFRAQLSSPGESKTYFLTATMKVHWCLVLYEFEGSDWFLKYFSNKSGHVHLESEFSSSILY